jgi:hypothetical protein
MDQASLRALRMDHENFFQRAPKYLALNFGTLELLARQRRRLYSENFEFEPAKVARTVGGKRKGTHFSTRASLRPPHGAHKGRQTLRGREAGSLNGARQ